MGSDDSQGRAGVGSFLLVLIRSGGPVLAAALLGACAAPLATGTVPEVDPTKFVPGLPNGYQCPLVPNGFDPAGSIYRLDKSGAYYRVKDFSKEPAFASMADFKREVPVSNYVLSDKQTSTAGLSFEILKNALPGLSGGSADFNKEITVDITVEDMVGEVIDDTVADKIVQWFEANVQPKPGSKYYLVRETLRAGAVSYRLKSADLAKLGGKTQVEKLAEGNANVTIRDNAGAFEIKQKFSPERIHVCIKSAEIVVRGPKPAQTAESTTDATLKSPEETTVPTIKRVGAN
jgi:hypothetical protein